MNSTNTLPEDNFVTIYTDSDISRMKSKLRAMTRKRDKMAIEIAKIQNLPNIWTIHMINWNDPNVKHLETDFKNLQNWINELTWEITEAEAANKGTLEFVHAERVVYRLMNKVPMETFHKYLISLGLTTHGLIGKVAENPKFIEETFMSGKYD